MQLTEQANFYNELWADRLQMNSLQLRRALKVLEYFSEIKRKNREPRVLDLGCGDGRFTSFIGEFSSADGIELSEKTVETAKMLYPHVCFFNGSALEFEFEHEAYDVVVSQEVIEHIEDQKKYLEVCEKVLKKGGYLIMTTPNKKVFDHMEGGNWSNQPIEQIMKPKEFKALIGTFFKLKRYDSIIMDFGNMGYFKLINHRLVIGGCNRLGLRRVREALLSRFGFGLHQCILAQKL